MRIRSVAGALAGMTLRAGAVFAGPSIAASSAAPAAATPAAPVHGVVLMRPDSLRRFRPSSIQAQPAARDTQLLENEPPEPRASYGSFEAARESLAALLRRVLGVCADSARWKRGRTDFLYHDRLTLQRIIHGGRFWSVVPRDSNTSVSSLTVTLVTTTDGCPGDIELRKALAAAGWEENFHYSADGPDGTDFAYFCREALCAVQMQWDGGDESDSTDVRKPGYALELTCVPRPREDPAYRRARGR